MLLDLEGEKGWNSGTKVWPADATQLVTYLDPSTSTVLLLRSRRGAIEDELHDSHLRDTKYRTNQQVLLCLDGSGHMAGGLMQVPVHHSEARATSHQVQAMLGQFHQVGS